MLVVDTNVMAYLLIEGERTEQAAALYSKDSDWASEAFLFIELTNILATYERSGHLDPSQSDDLLESAARTLQRSIAIAHSAALRAARESGVSAYDGRFLAAAESLGARLVTEDRRLRNAAPRLTLSINEALAE